MVEMIQCYAYCITHSTFLCAFSFAPVCKGKCPAPGISVSFVFRLLAGLLPFSCSGVKLDNDDRFTVSSIVL